MSGDNVSSEAARQKISKKTEDISKYEAKIGLYPVPSEHPSCDLLELTGEEVSKFTPEQCLSAATDLTNYVLFVQRTISRERSILNWLISRINLSIASELQSYEGYYSHEQRRTVAIVNNTYAKELEEFRINSQIKVDMLDGLTYQINQKCRVLLEAHAQKKYNQTKQQ